MVALWCLSVALLLVPAGHLPTRLRLDRLAARDPPGEPAQSSPLSLAELADSCEVLAACLDAGLAPRPALEATAVLLPEDTAALLRQVTHRLAVGMDPDQAWAISHPTPPLADLGALLTRAERSGAPLHAELTRHAAQLRDQAHAAALARAHRAAVLMTAPLGVCFLPAFILLGIVPVVAGLATTMF